jgi:hypothetical protein
VRAGAGRQRFQIIKHIVNGERFVPSCAHLNRSIYPSFPTIIGSGVRLCHPELRRWRELLIEVNRELEWFTHEDLELCSAILR